MSTSLRARSTSRFCWRTAMRLILSEPSIEAALARASRPMYGSNRSEPKSIVKKTPASMKLTSNDAEPCLSYRARVCGSARTW